MFPGRKAGLHFNKPEASSPNGSLIPRKVENSPAVLKQKSKM